MLSSWGAIGLVPIRRPAPRPEVKRMRYGLPPDTEPVTTIRVRMLKASKATLDGGRTTIEYEAGKDYDLPEWLAEAFFRGGEADPAEAYEQHDQAGNFEAGAAPVQTAPTQPARQKRRASPGKT